MSELQPILLGMAPTDFIELDRLLAKVRWLVIELDDVRATAVRLQSALERAVNAAETDRMASRAANSTILALRDTPTPVRPSDRLEADDWLAHRGNIPLAGQLASS